ncbi:MAG: hypothetical protein A2381_06495 [Bdellovibrionales bacterium RIFOXYB1_FULL_37_110]|nr:MAG: hypothetical protein A2181_08515 [Bdellovibrionales bacterium RIFOXYA1_FULL_38_20]OFZ50191.1 MAG: hypothetical protein A2417_19345 [Bdellovibrionales bacterium RIFOXYC1_FULL_37_79]OFZ53236.1 MAG: hypothetical protein A2328_06285 [Bdellovibrionales bacterium RIFOXYB2_FULL_36_6]OFZ57628.1 MAG: hypothetical protein A2381_06495 [Bdellovibrionales bacterium RIFOXYB1_FULL_37_110]OFZ61395.1 MAG: hypothetical protein A2577_00860 [Bdellovibrionales bacterium RIFOXYD1_FULL_36_51]
MVSFSKNHNITSYYLLDMYLMSTFIISVFMWVGSYWLKDHFFYDGFFVTFFLVTNYYYFINGIGWSKLTLDKIQWPGLLLLQIFCLFGQAHVTGNLTIIYLSVIPASFGLFFFSSKNEWPISGYKKGVVLLLIVAFTYLIINSLTQKTLFTVGDFFYFCLFLMWGASIIIWGQYHLHEEKKSLFDIFLTGIKPNSEQELSDWPHDRLFFHDLINQTHGIDLFLNQKMSQKTHLAYEEMEILRDEIRLVQSLLQNHYGYFHKNLFGRSDYVSIGQMKKMIFRIANIYLPDQLVFKSFTFQGFFQDEGPEEMCLVHYPTFCRIFTNLVKNLNEVNTNHVEFFFGHTEEELMIHVKNKVCYLKDDEENMVKNLKDIILGVNHGINVNRESGLGMESIAHLVKKYEGTFHFELQGEYWVNQISLPFIKGENVLIGKSKKKAA